MSVPPKPSYFQRLLLGAFIAILAFAALFEAVSLFGKWPALPHLTQGGFDLAVGFFFVLTVVVAAVRARRLR